MKRAALVLFLLGNALALTPQQIHSARSYGQKALEAYRAHDTKLAPGRAAVLSCQKIVPRVPDTVEECRLHLWGAQAVAEVVTHDPIKHLGAVSGLWLGQMRGVPSVAQAQLLAQALAKEFSVWNKTQAAKSWFKAQGTPHAGIVGGGFRVPCAQFSARHLPAGILACSEGPGPLDGPTVTIKLADGHIIDAGVR